MLPDKIGVMQGRLSKPVNNKIQSFPNRNWKKEFLLAKKLSVKFIEWTLDFKKLHKNPILTKKGIKNIKLLSKKYNVKVESITGDCFMQKPFWKQKSKKVRIYLLNDLKKILISASALKIKYLIIPLVDNGSLKNEIQEKILIGELIKFKKMLKDNNLSILFETDFSPKKNFIFMKKFKSKNFGINYDIGNSASKNFKPQEELRYYGKYIKNVHVKDRKKFGNTVKLGTGNVNFDLVFSLLKKIRYKGNYILQTARGIPGKEKINILNNLKFLNQYK
jgi:L-ribulose-5-phosphate 3-epimerase